jgi:phosphomannomutase
MAETGAVFGGEHSGHFYFKDFWRADSGMLAALHALAALSQSDKKLSNILQSYNRYASSGEINSVVEDAVAVMAKIETHYAPMNGITVDHLDGLTVESADWWFNVRASNTEPLLRLNVEATTESLMHEIRGQALALIGGK